MNGVVCVSQELPANIEDLAKFVLVGREKLVSVRAEIRAIDKLNIAEDVRKQKRDEAQMLSEALLDAEVRIGELLKELPTAGGGDRRSEDFKKGITAPFEKPKLEIVQELGFNRDQAKRFETLAANKAVVEQVKAEARENEDIPTRSRVLQLVKEKNKPAQADPDFAYRSTQAINEAIGNASTLNVDKERLVCWANSLRDNEEKDFQIMMIDDAIAKLRITKAFLTKSKVR